MKIIHPYLESQQYIWARGNLHTHTSESDGAFTPNELVNRYRELGFQFLMISEHDFVLPTASLNSDGMIVIQGNEITENGPHLLHVDAQYVVDPHKDRQRVIDDILAQGGFAIVNHPNWEEDFNHCPQKLLEQWKGYTGIEIYNGIVRWLPGSPNATDRWDQLLSQGRKIWGFANDDAHWEETFGVAWNTVQVEVLTKEQVVNALKTGRFYASTGVIIEEIRCSHDEVWIKTANATKSCVITDYGRRIHEEYKNYISFKVPPDFPFTYFRFEFWGGAEEQAWTQPFFVKK